MPDPRVGSLDNPQRYGCRSIAVYENSTGFYIKLDGSREKVHGNQLWTSLGGIKMRGLTPFDQAAPQAPYSDWDDEEERQIAAAIAASLQDESPAWGADVQADEEVPPADNDAAGDATAGASTGTSSGSRECAICLTEPSVMLMKPCNHVCACQTCARRLVRHPCVMCRRMVTKVERVYF